MTWTIGVVVTIVNGATNILKSLENPNRAVLVVGEKHQREMMVEVQVVATYLVVVVMRGGMVVAYQVVQTIGAGMVVA